MRRETIATVMNLLVPGIGLILLGRFWLGLVIALGFGCLAEIALWGWLLAPAAMPMGLMLATALCALAGWGLAQVLLVNRVRLLQSPGLSEEIAVLRQLAHDKLEAGDFRTAKAVLSMALSLDDRDVATRVLWARLLSEVGSLRRARRAWFLAARMDRTQDYRPEIRQGIQHLQQKLPPGG